MKHGKNVDLLIINPGNAVQVYQSLGLGISAYEPPVWAGLLATFMRLHGFSVEMIDANAEGFGPKSVADLTEEMDPLLTAVVVYGHQPSASTQNMPAASAVCHSIRQVNSSRKTILIGGHVAALPGRTLQEEPVDFVCGGEAPYTLLDLIKVLKSNRNAFSEVRGLWYRENGQVRSTRPAPLVADLNGEMPGVAWDLLPMGKYRAHNWHCFGYEDRQPYASLYTTLGCPFHCTFCCIQAPFKSGEQELGYGKEINSYRYWNPEKVMEQIDTLVQTYGVKHLKFADEMFVLNKSHVSAICDLLIERDYKLNIWTYARVDTVKEGMVEKLKKAGVNWLAFGIESGSKRIRTGIGKKFEQDEIVNVIKEVRQAGINVIANFIFGIPDDNYDTMQDTLDLALSLNCEFVNFYTMMAYPGSALYHRAAKEGWKLPKKWSGYSQHSFDALPLATKYVSAEEIVEFRDRAFQTYFNSPAYVNLIQKKFGTETLRQIREMTSHKLARQSVPETQKSKSHLSSAA